ncbi:MAG TPA: AbrB/MazE/SpoVT family DNA-binding domain-containing protein [Nitrosomonas europaea]|uniref:AbrB/MazE/SpoVT family DNA-binding domain-containing protein n=1 Tax=Nitrosomonas europaea TaxID=915 RepID=UPI00248FB876|nr:AbrB/MazE/SpoVT family DNA-binding domain-containing protein [Nitrosomonas europaea]HNR11221.1 AbrB/MazE/SpoVT family DNA-binding domain-containing protein [Nitrosomonas europaea]HRO57542.1 AbrB/MazE/SpoVT family DNA-binding domain-containing protein [Nitrosomonas europaea]HUM75139.1 AbrB/MazE/SpoVT family DNA-binding domain-containing protein [Nitrosomonas europaea]
MSKVSAKRQITLPVDQCQALGIQPGDEVEIFIYDGHLTLVKKMPGSAYGLLRNVKPKSDISDEESRQSAIV